MVKFVNKSVVFYLRLNILKLVFKENLVFYEILFSNLFSKKLKWTWNFGFFWETFELCFL